MRCAIYARKSTDENDKNHADKSVARQIAQARQFIKKRGDHADKSVARQIAQARQFIKKRGWNVAEEHADDGISGAEFDKRPGFRSLLESVKAKRVPHRRPRWGHPYRAAHGSLPGQHGRRRGQR